MIKERESIKNLKPYTTFEPEHRVKLDANEGKNYLIGDLRLSDIELNRYPDNEALKLRQAIGELVGASYNNIIIGNGSFDILDYIFRAFIDKNDTVLSYTPSFALYEKYCTIYGAKLENVLCNEDFTIDINKLINKANEINPKMILVCNPNNPTGKLIKRGDIIKLIENTNSLVVVDEAYIEFSGETVVDLYDKYNNLIITRTLSKALALAGIRVGYMISGDDLTEKVNKIRPPYNVSSLAQAVALNAIKNGNKINRYIEVIKTERDYLYTSLKLMGIEAFESEASFIMFYSSLDDLFERLIEKGILINKLGDLLDGYYRVTVGSFEENELFINTLKEILDRK